MSGDSSPNARLEPAGTVGLEMSERPLFGKVFMVVEDDPYSRRIVEQLLRDLGGAEVVLAADGIEAVSRAQSFGRNLDCIVSDLNMKPMHGLYLLQSIRAGVIGLSRATPAVIVTGNANDRLLRYAIELDCNGFVAKPVSKERIRKAVTRALSESFELKEPRDYAAIKLPSRILATEYVKINGIDFPVYNSASPKAPSDREAPPEILRMYPNAHAVTLSQVQPGALVTREICSGDGMLLVAPGVELTKLIIERLKELSEMDPAVETIWIG